MVLIEIQKRFKTWQERHIPLLTPLSYLLDFIFMFKEMEKIQHYDFPRILQQKYKQEDSYAFFCEL
jgi:hypothetical protein